MIPQKLIEKVPATSAMGELCLYQHDSEFSIRIDGQELMNSSVHYSEEMLASHACVLVANRRKARVLVGGLGMGFTAAAALAALGPDCEVVIAELIPAVIRWVCGPLAHLTGGVLVDPRVKIVEVDIVKFLQMAPHESFDAVLLDVDNGPRAITRRGNSWLYAPEGLAAAFKAIRPKGVLALWSAATDSSFGKALRKAGFAVQEIRCPERKGTGRKKHTIWLAVA